MLVAGEWLGGHGDRGKSMAARAEEASFGDLLRNRRAALGLTQEALAARAHVSVRSIRYMERGVRHAPQWNTVHLLAEALLLRTEERARFVEAAQRWGATATGSPDREDTAGPALPALIAPLLGRAEATRTLRELLCGGSTRLVTLTGTAGVGKTSLGLHVARECAPAFPGGVFFVALAAIDDPALLVPALAQALGVHDHGSRPLLESVRDILGQRTILLLLDNFEQIVTGAPTVAELLAHCPRLVVLATSRAALRLRGEQEWAVAPLTLPDGAGSLPPLGLAALPAVALFLRQARAVRADFRLTEANAAAVAEICRQLDGLPLAIELAAARMKILSPGALLARLEPRLDVLTDGPRDAPERHRTLRAALAWSYDLLPDHERAVFRRLCVFAGGCTLEAAEVVCAAFGTAGRGHTLAALAALVDKSLLPPPVEAVGGTMRFWPLETVRAYGLERLGEVGEEARTAEAHAAYYAALAEQAEAELAGPDQQEWLGRLEREHPNLRAALRWSRDSGAMPDQGLRMAAALWRFWWVRGHLGEGRDWLEGLLATGAGDPAVRIKALKGAGVLAAQQGAYERATTLHQASLDLAREIGDRAGVAAALNNLGMVASRRGQYARAATLYEQSLALQRALDNSWAVTIALNNLGTATLHQGNPDGATVLYEQSLALAQRRDDQWGIAAALNNLGIAARQKGNYAAATALYERSVAVQRALGHRQGEASTVLNLAELAHDQADDQRAAALGAESLALYRALGDRWGIASVRALLGHVARTQGQPGEACRHYAESLSLHGDATADVATIAACLEGVAAIASDHGQPDGAVRLLGAAATLRDVSSAPLAPPDRAGHAQTVVALRALLGEHRVTALWTVGAALSLQGAVDAALQAITMLCV